MRKYIFVFLLMVFGSAWCGPQPFAKFDDDRSSGDETSAVFRWGNKDISLLLKGDGQLKMESRAKKVNMQLPMSDYIFVMHAWSHVVGGDVIVAYELSDNDGGIGMICRMTLTRHTPLWCSKIPSFSVHVSMGEDAVYVGAGSFMGKLDPQNGRYFWQHTDLYVKDRDFNIVCPIGEDTDTVTFHAAASFGMPFKKAILERASGKIRATTSVHQYLRCP